MDSKIILVIGATGYVGGRLVPRLLESGYGVRAAGRSLSKLKGRPWARNSKVELAKVDVLNTESIKEAAMGCSEAFYLVSPINSRKKDVTKADRRAARNVAKAADQAGLKRIIHLGYMGRDGDGRQLNSKRSANGAANILQCGPVSVTVFRVAMILGSGSIFFETLRYLVDRMPVMITPRWVNTVCQPIAIHNVLNYLTGCLEQEETVGKTFDIGGPDVLTYREMMDIYAEEAHLPKRLMIPGPFVTTDLSAYWIHLISSIPVSLTTPLIIDLHKPMLCRDTTQIRSLIPQELLSCRKTIRMALERIRQGFVETSWSDAGMLRCPEWTYCGDVAYAGGDILECGYHVQLRATSEEVWQAVSRIGGETGWYFGNILWRIRGGLDLLIGGNGLRRGRRHPSEFFVGDSLDFWRVLEVEDQCYLLLLAEMKMPGEGLMEIRITKVDGDLTEVHLFSRFLPKGLLGIVYWYVLYPFHQYIYRGILKSIARSIGKPIVMGPTRFTAKLPRDYSLFGRKK